MNDFYLDENRMSEYAGYMDKILSVMQESYQDMTRLLSRIESEKQWTGQAQKEFMAYMGLLKQYHAAFSEEGDGNNPIAQAVEHLDALNENLNSFYDNFVQYKKLEEI